MAASNHLILKQCNLAISSILFRKEPLIRNRESVTSLEKRILFD